jgi:hypothetical protein
MAGASRSGAVSVLVVMMGRSSYQRRVAVSLRKPCSGATGTLHNGPT